CIVLIWLRAWPEDVVDLFGLLGSLPGGPRMLAEHMGYAMFSGRPQFARNADGRWMLADSTPNSYAVARGASRSIGHSADDVLHRLSYVVVDTATTGGRSWLGDRITEIAAVVVRHGQMREVYDTRVT